MKDAKILSLVPAAGWFAVFRGRVREDGEFRSPLICWALVEAEDGERSVVGLDTDQRGTVEICAYADNFLRYEFGELTSGGRELADAGRARRAAQPARRRPVVKRD